MTEQCALWLNATHCVFHMIKTDQDKWAARPKTTTRFGSFTEVFFLDSLKYCERAHSNLLCAIEHLHWDTTYFLTHTQHTHTACLLLFGSDYVAEIFSLDLFLSSGYLIVCLLSQRLLRCVVLQSNIH